MNPIITSLAQYSLNVCKLVNSTCTVCVHWLYAISLNDNCCSVVYRYALPTAYTISGGCIAGSTMCCAEKRKRTLVCPYLVACTRILILLFLLLSYCDVVCVCLRGELLNLLVLPQSPLCWCSILLPDLYLCQHVGVWLRLKVRVHCLWFWWCGIGRCGMVAFMRERVEWFDQLLWGYAPFRFMIP